MEELTGGSKAGGEREWRDPMVEEKSSGDQRERRWLSSGCGDGEALVTVVGEVKSWGRRRSDRSGPLFMGGIRSGLRTSRPRSLRSWVGSVLCRATRDVPKSARSGHTGGHIAPTVGLRIGCGSRRANPSIGVLGQKHSSAFLTRQDPGWDPAHELEFNPVRTVIFTGGALSG